MSEEIYLERFRPLDPEIEAQRLCSVVTDAVAQRGFRAIHALRSEMLARLERGEVEMEEFKALASRMIQIGVACGADMSQELKQLQYLAKAEGWGKAKGDGDEEKTPDWAKGLLEKGA